MIMLDKARKFVVMKRMVLMSAVVLAMATGSMAANWEIDGAHSSVGFTVKHLVISKVTGKFDDFSGTIEFDGKSVKPGSVNVTVKTASIDTDNEKRDEHLRSADFFDAAKNPEMSFKSTKVVPGAGNKFKLVGDLTIKAVTKPVTFDCEFNGAVDFMGTTKAGFSAQASINRQDFNITFSRVMETGGLVVSDEVEILLEIEANKKG
jgi:polyisoprenoid-binding protein YceI